MIPPRVAVLVRSLSRKNEHELVTTVRAIGAALRSADLDFHDLADALERAQACSAQKAKTADRTPGFGDLARWTRDLDQGRLSSRERSFVAGMCAKGFGFRPTSAQSAWLTSIFDRLCAGRAAA